MCERCKAHHQRNPTCDVSADDILRGSHCLTQALGEAFKAPSDAATQVRLQDAMCEYVALLKEGGFAAERVLIEFKQIVASVMQPDDLFGPASIVHGAISLCIEEYYHRHDANGQRLISSR